MIKKQILVQVKNSSMPTIDEFEIEKILTFIRETVKFHKKKCVIIGVSGGIDSAVALTLLTMAMGKKKIIPMLLPYNNQSTHDSELICIHNGYSEKSIMKIDITSIVESYQKKISKNINQLRLGNIQARVRMTLLFDKAHELDGLVCGTENKSEHYLGYFTRFGDEASDFEPLRNYYKTQVKQLAAFLKIPTLFIDKKPSANLWKNQTDEDELGFTYQEADEILNLAIDNELTEEKIFNHSTIDPKIIKKILNKVAVTEFKRITPYLLN